MGIMFDHLSKTLSPTYAANQLVTHLGWKQAQNMALHMRDESHTIAQRRWVEELIDELESTRPERDTTITEGSGR